MDMGHWQQPGVDGERILFFSVLMSDDPETIKEIAQSAIREHGWVVGFLTTTWAVILRAIIGGIAADRKLLRARLDNIEALLARQDERLKHIEQRSTLRRHSDPPCEDIEA